MTDAISASDIAPWPSLNPQRVSEAVQALAEGIEDPALRAQLHALATVIGPLSALPPDPRAQELGRVLARALERDDEAGVVSAARELAAHNRSLAQSVDWSAVSGG